MKVLIGSNNPVKIEAVKEAFGKYFENVEITGINVESEVDDQPINEETFDGARKRVMNLRAKAFDEKIEADYFVGIEGGIINHYNKWFAFGAVCISDKEGNKGFGTSPGFELPYEVSSRLLKREELGDVMDDILKQKNTKQKKGAIGFFTNEVITRKELYIPGVISAIVPFLHEEMYFRNDAKILSI